ncbi:MAG: DUF3365 domain-containing protein [Gammaproteobacteria bacterium]|nr:DUF3365 domain-containing protein [Gammaproteobacteria bacterium]
MSLNFKFNAVLITVLLVGFAITSALAYQILLNSAKEEVLERAGLMMEAARATRGYTIDEVAPLLRPHMASEFLPQTVPAYAATQTFNQLRKTHAQYTYKEATLNPTNPRDRPADWENDIIRTFRNHADRAQVSGPRQTPEGESLYLARPIKITNAACLTCHSTPEAAPASLISKYGDANGFGWALNEVVGAQIVSVPASVPVERARRVLYTFLLAMLGVMVITVVALNILLRKVVIGPVTTLSALANQVSQGEMNAEEFSAVGKDEVAELGRAFNRLRRSVEKALAMLERG